MKTDDLREQFEKYARLNPHWCFAADFLLRRKDDEYEDVGIQIAWEAYQHSAAAGAEASSQELRQLREEVERQTDIPSTADEQVIQIVGPMVRKIYGDSAELGHYKLAKECWLEGRTGLVIVLGQLGRAKLRAEAAEAELQRLREALPGLATKIVENAYRNSIPQRPVIGDAIEVEAALLAKWMASELGMK